MRPVFEAIAGSASLELQLLVTGMHLAPRFSASYEEIEADAYGVRHVVSVFPEDGSGTAMAKALGQGLVEITEIMGRVEPALVLVQGDRGEMLAAAAAGAHLNIPVVHMSGGDRTGSIDDAIRNAITSFAHVHLTTCEGSTARLRDMGEAPNRIFKVGEPTLDVILNLDPLSRSALCADLGLDPERPIVLATQHPVTDQAASAGVQVRETLAALTDLGMQTVFTYPNTDAGHQAIIDALEAWQPRNFLRVVPHLGQLRYLSLMREAVLLVGNSSSGILEAPSFNLPVVNVGTRQHRRTRACNVIDVACERQAINAAMRRALHDAQFRAGLAECRNPYGDGRCAGRTASILEQLRLSPALTAKWLDEGASVLLP